MTILVSRTQGRFLAFFQAVPCTNLSRWRAVFEPTMKVAQFEEPGAVTVGVKTEESLHLEIK